jgi:dienelactone hydrolase
MDTVRSLSALLISSAVSGGLVADGGEEWSLLRVPGFWEKDQGGIVEKLDGIAWYRAFVKVPAEWRGDTLRLSLGRIDDCDETFWNGARIGAGGSREPYRSAAGEDRNYAVPPDRVRFGEFNLLAVRVFDGGGGGGIAAGPLRLRSKAGALELAGKWQFRPGDDPSWSAWPADPGSAAADALAAGFERDAGPGFGKTVDERPLPGTSPLEMEGDIASELVAAADRFLLAEIDRSVEKRARRWKRDLSSPESYRKSIEGNRGRFRTIAGAVDPRVPFEGPELAGTTAEPALVARGDGYEIQAIRWPAFGDVHGEGLLLTPAGRERVADVVAIPDSGQTPEEIAGLVEGTPPGSQFARRLAESGCRVVVPVLIDRGVTHRQLANREFLYRSAFELGRHLIGYEVQKVLAAVDWFEKEAGGTRPRIGVVGWGEGGLLALYAAALDERIGAALVSGYFEDRRNVWQEPIDRNVFGLLEEFGDAEIASLIAPRALIVEAARGPELVLPGRGGAPSRLVTPKLADARAELERARRLTAGLSPPPRLELVASGDGGGPPGSAEALERFLEAAAGAAAKLAPAGTAPRDLRRSFDPQARLRRQMHEIDRHSQWLLGESPYVRAEFMKKLDTSSLSRYQESARPYRDYFYDEVIGRFEYPPLPPNARTRKLYDLEKWTGYEVVLDVFQGVFAYGILLLPKDLKPGDRRPVVVCQHGLEGRPEDTIRTDVPGYQYYHAFAAKLAERGYITFAPQNLYLFGDRFRTLQRKANPLKKSLFSLITPQHQQIVDWLERLEGVDPRRIAFYGLSYGGKTAMRVPALVTDYCLSICSADFNEWVWKNASTRSPYSYVWTGEYEIFEFNLGSTFNYAEMAALIAPRPFMVERGHFDGVAPDETVGYEFAKVRFLYEARLGLTDHAAIEWFVGPHTINGKGTFEFLEKHLKN